MARQHAPAIVLSHGPGGLGAARSLARRGVPVTAVAFDATDPVLWSRLPVDRVAVSGETNDQRESRLLECLDRLPLQGAAVLATSDRMVAFLDRHRNALQKKYRFRLPPSEVLHTLNDKRLETEQVKRFGFSIPETVTELPERPEELFARLRFPIIFKPHVYSVQNVFPPKNAIVHNKPELESFYVQWRHALHVLLAQEVIPGPDDASWICSGTFDETHELLECGVKQKLRAFPAHFGGSTFAISRTNEPVLELARALGRKLRYVGHAGIEYRWDERDGEYRYIEWNPRLPANVGFDEACGLPTVWNSYQVALHGRVERTDARQKVGIYYLDLRGDLFSLREDHVSKPAALLTLLRNLLTKKTNGPYFAWDDPAPGLVVAWRFLSKAWKTVQRRVRLKHATAGQRA